jgi:hypothetical protein
VGVARDDTAFEVCDDDGDAEAIEEVGFESCELSDGQPPPR